MTFKYDFFKNIYLIYLCISQVLCDFGITNINILDGYYEDASRFIHNQPMIDGITLILPQSSPKIPPHSYSEPPDFRHNIRPKIRPKTRSKIRTNAPSLYSAPFDELKSSQWTPSKRKRKHFRNGNIKYRSKLNRPLSLYDSLPPNSIPTHFDFDKPFKKLSDAKSQTSDAPNEAITLPKSFNAKNVNNNRQIRPKKFRTATANQISHKNRDYEEKKHNDKSFANDDPNHYPHQYAIEIRWKDKKSMPSGDYGGREMHSSKDFEHSKYRLFEHKEEEHWHEKKWLKEGLKKTYNHGKSFPTHIVRPHLKIETNAHYNPLPIYAQPMPDGSTLEEIDEHFAIPTKSFRVNNRFINWAENDIDLNEPNNYMFNPSFGI